MHAAGTGRLFFFVYLGQQAASMHAGPNGRARQLPFFLDLEHDASGIIKMVLRIVYIGGCYGKSKGIFYGFSV